MPKNFQKTLSIGLSGLLVLGISVASTADSAARQPNVLHEMVPHVVLPETIQYNKTAKNLPGTGYAGVSSPYVATYIAHPSYQVPPTTAFQPVGQSVYPVTPKLLSQQPVPKEEPKEEPKEGTNPDDFVGSDFVLQGRDVQLNDKASEPIQLAASSDSVVPMLPRPNVEVQQAGVFCQQPAKPPSAWAFSSPLFKVASVPGSWGGGQMGGIHHNSPRGSQQNIGFQPVGIDPAAAGAVPQGIPYSTFQMGQQAPDQGFGTQAQILPNGMILLTMPPDHRNCGLIRCRTGFAPRTMLLPPAPTGYGSPSPQSTMPQNMTMPEMQTTFGGMSPYMSVAAQQSMMPQIQTVPVTVMTPMGPAVVGYQQTPMMNPMMNQMAAMNQFPQFQQIPGMVTAMPNPPVAAQVTGAAEETGDETVPPSANPMTLMATPFGYYAVQSSSETLQADPTAQHIQMQHALLQPHMLQPQMMAANPYTGLYATPFGYIAMNPQAGGYGQFGNGMVMMNAGFCQPGMPMGMSGGGQGITVSDMLQIMAFLNANKPQQRRARLVERLAERRENRQAAGNDPFAQLMQAWTTPYVAPDMTLRMPSRNAYPYGYFGVQALPADTANYGGYHNLYFGNTTYPGLY